LADQFLGFDQIRIKWKTLDTEKTFIRKQENTPGKFLIENSEREKRKQ
jgi:hypothetical protein